MPPFTSSVDPSSQITLKVYEKHGFRSDDLIATFVISYDVLRSSRNGRLLLGSLIHKTEFDLMLKVTVECVDNAKKKNTPSREISVTWSECDIISAEPE